MNKLEENMQYAIRNGMSWQQGNTAVIKQRGNVADWFTVTLHGHVIAVVTSKGDIVANHDTFREYPTKTTISRLKALGIDASVKNGVPHIDGEPI